MAKYDPLRTRPEGVVGSEVTLTLGEVAQLVGGLPASARVYRAWWANDPTHVQACAWLDAGWQVTDVNLGAARVRFARAARSSRRRGLLRSHNPRPGTTPQPLSRAEHPPPYRRPGALVQGCASAW